MTREEIEAKLADLRATYAQTEAVRVDPYTKPERVAAAERYLAGCAAEISRYENML